MTAYASVNGETLIEVSLHVPNVGPWWADCVFEIAPDVSGPVTLVVGELSLTGTITENGTFAEQRRARVVAGAGGWATLVAAQHYHNDLTSDGGGGVRARTVADDAARLAGETIGTFAVADERIGADYVRESGLASRVLEDVIGGAPWHVDYSGNTNVGERSTNTPNEDIYQVLDFDPREKLITLAVDDLSAVGVGSIITEGLDEQETIREIQVKVSADTARVIAWVGGTGTGRGRLAGLLRGIIETVADDNLFGVYRYRVLAMSGNRTELQVVRQNGRLPDTIPLDMKPGVAGAHSKLTPGMVVLVQFIDGLPTLPIVTAFAGKDEGTHETDELDFTVSTVIRLGDDTASDAVALAPTIDSQFDDINQALDAFAVAVPVPNDGGAFIHTAFTTVWGAGAPPKPASSVGATKVVAK